MGVYCRYFVTDARDVSLADIATALKNIDRRFVVEGLDEGEDATHPLYFNWQLYGNLETYRPGKGPFEEEVNDFIELLTESSAKGKGKAIEGLKRARCTVRVQLLYAGRGLTATFQGLQPLWSWLIENREGMLQADELGFYEGKNVLVMEEEYQ